jgi:lactoylglutathione lyase
MISSMENRGFVKGAYHVGITVQDMDRSLQFYLGQLGLELILDTIFDKEYILQIVSISGLKCMRIALLRIPDSELVIELLEYREVERFSSSSRPCDPGSGHLCLYVVNIDQLHHKLKASGVRFRSEHPIEVTHGPNAGAKVMYMMDPDGFIIELFEKNIRGEQHEV